MDTEICTRILELCGYVLPFHLIKELRSDQYHHFIKNHLFRVTSGVRLIMRKKNVEMKIKRMGQESGFYAEIYLSIDSRIQSSNV